MHNDRPSFRSETRKERYAAKAKTAIQMKVSIATTFFQNEGNVAFISRALACFGGNNLEIIGKRPAHNELSRLSGGNCDLVNIRNYSNFYQFLDKMREENVYLVAAELSEKAISIVDFNPPKDRQICIIIGNEMEGIPVDLLINADQEVFVPMPGRGYCLNASQTANVFMYEMSRKFGSF